MIVIMYSVTVYPGHGNSWSVRREYWQEAQDDAQLLARIHGGRATVRQVRVIA